MLLTEWQDQNNHPVIIPPHLDRQGSVKLENRIPSAYGKENFSALLGENNENILYTKENKDINPLLAGRLQLPTNKSGDVFISNNSMPHSQEKVKPRGFTESYLESPLPSEAERANIQDKINQKDNDFTYEQKSNNGTLFNVAILS